MAYKITIAGGFTLVEMLVVISIISILFGISSGFYSKFEQRFDLSNATLHTTAILRQAKEMSREQNITTTCRINKPDEIELWGARQTGFWHCDSLVSDVSSSNIMSTPGIFGLVGKARNIQIAPGKIRSSFLFLPDSQLKLATYAQLNLQQGMLLSFWIYPEKVTGYSVRIAKLEDSFEMSLNSEYRLIIHVGKNKFVGNTPLLLYQWSHINIRWYNQKFIVTSNSLPIISESCGIVNIPSYAYLEFGGGFRGKIDQIEVRSWSLFELYRIPNDIQITEAPQELHFQGKRNCEFVGDSAGRIVLSKNNEHHSEILIRPLGDICYQLPNH